jgi:glycosyltransferase involved in cell wall biosynthesis
VVRALLITAALPPRPGRDVNGIYQRHALFVAALAAVAGQVRIAHLVPPAVAAAWPDAAELDRVQSDYWQCPVSVALLPRRSRRETMANHYFAGIAAAGWQPEFFPFGGAVLGAALRAEIAAAAPDLVLAMELPAMLALRAAGSRPPRLCFDFNDVPHRVRLRALRQLPQRPSKLLRAAQLPALVAAAHAAARAAETTFVCSELDRRHLARWGIAGNALAVANAVAVPPAPPPLPAAPTLLFLGAFHYRPNVEAAERLARRILPRVRAALPAARLLLAGDGSDRLAFAGLEGVSGLGFVPDLAALYAESRVVCAPIVNGGGTRLKLIEAAAYARPMVATAVGAEGLAFADGEQILLREDDAALAAACVRLLQDDALAARLGLAARAVVRAQYEAGAIRARLAGIFAAPA